MAKALALIYFIWGFNWVVMKLANEYFSPTMFVTYRFTSGALVLLLVTLFLRLPLPEKRFWPWIALTGATQISLNSIIVQFCITPLGSGLSAVLNYTMPIWTALLAQPLLGEKLTPKKIIGILVSLAGLAIIMNIDLEGNLIYLPVAISGAFLWALGNVIYKLKLTECNMTVFNTWQMSIGALILIVVSLATGQDTGNLTTLSAGFIIYNGVLASALAFFLWSYILSRMEASLASVAILAVPAVGVLCGAVFLSEPLTPARIAGMALILIGIVTVTYHRKA